jgi:hypothetical protein
MLKTIILVILVLLILNYLSSDKVGNCSPKYKSSQIIYANSNDMNDPSFQTGLALDRMSKTNEQGISPRSDNLEIY